MQLAVVPSNDDVIVVDKHCKNRNLLTENERETSIMVGAERLEREGGDRGTMDRGEGKGQGEGARERRRRRKRERGGGRIWEGDKERERDT